MGLRISISDVTEVEGTSPNDRGLGKPLEAPQLSNADSNAALLSEFTTSQMGNVQLWPV